MCLFKAPYSIFCYLNRVFLFVFALCGFFVLFRFCFVFVFCKGWNVAGNYLNVFSLKLLRSSVDVASFTLSQIPQKRLYQINTVNP